ncbi:hypothetical protein GGTG_01538 [Gaeumannomyces tritici R3-111a-1]|uniref:Involucrin repeat protein n=1 Tax=Gaeumannomyces tritici (strain R3-111a-1) TaxID=644352 RepID=J3NJV7_GAET3|nr:hypothetical protein GGTG_01538 [Gaeumannomyces tritici R3-111a-1]EJT81560.1 hypothetical protein GGTG_01538 [Gaeumannomyces tritici R3-111a-1]
MGDRHRRRSPESSRRRRRARQHSYETASAAPAADNMAPPTVASPSQAAYQQQPPPPQQQQYQQYQPQPQYQQYPPQQYPPAQQYPPHQYPPPQQYSSPQHNYLAQPYAPPQHHTPQPYSPHQQVSPQQAVSQPIPVRQRARDSSSDLSESSSTSESLLNISARRPRAVGFFSFFSGPSPESQRRKAEKKKKKKKKGLLQFGNSSSSSFEESLAYGRGYVSRDPSFEQVYKQQEQQQLPPPPQQQHYGAPHVDHTRPSPPHRNKTDEEILEIGRKLAKMAREENKEDLARAGRRPTSQLVAAATAISNFRRKNTADRADKDKGIGSSKPQHDDDESDWETSSEDEFSSEDVDMGLAYGSSPALAYGFSPALPASNFSQPAPRPAETKPMHLDSHKSNVVDPRKFGPHNSLRGLITSPCGFDDSAKRPAGVASPRQERPSPRHHRATASVESASLEGRPMQHVYPAPTSDPDNFDVGRPPQQSSGSRPDPVPIQAPKPITPISARVYEADRYRAPESRRSDDHKRQSGGSSLVGAALGGLVGAAGLAAVAKMASDDKNVRDRRREDGALEEKSGRGEDSRRRSDAPVEVGESRQALDRREEDPRRRSDAPVKVEERHKALVNSGEDLRHRSDVPTKVEERHQVSFDRGEDLRHRGDAPAKREEHHQTQDDRAKEPRQRSDAPAKDEVRRQTQDDRGKDLRHRNDAPAKLEKRHEALDNDEHVGDRDRNSQEVLKSLDDNAKRRAELEEKIRMLEARVRANAHDKPQTQGTQSELDRERDGERERHPKDKKRKDTVTEQPEVAPAPVVAEERERRRGGESRDVQPRAENSAPSSGSHPAERRARDVAGQGSSVPPSDGASVDPVKAQVTDDVFPTSLGSATPVRPLTPMVTTVEREPDFANFDTSKFILPRDPPQQPSGGRLSRLDSFEKSERDAERRESDRAREISESSTAPIPEAAMAAAAAVLERHNHRGRAGTRAAEPQPSRSRSQDGEDAEDTDVVQEEANKYYRQTVAARKIEEETIRSRSASPDSSVMDKYDQGEDPIIRIVTPPHMHRKEKSIWEGPNADVKVDNFIKPQDLATYRLPREERLSTSTARPIFWSRDPSCERPRPMLNIVCPTPIPTPSPEKQQSRSEPKEPEPEDGSDDKPRSTPTAVLNQRGQVVEAPSAPTTESSGQKQTRHSESDMTYQSPRHVQDEPGSDSAWEDKSEPTQDRAPEKKRKGGWGAVLAAITGVGVASGAAAAAKAVSDNEKEKQAEGARELPEQDAGELPRVRAKELPEHDAIERSISPFDPEIAAAVDDDQPDAPNSTSTRALAAQPVDAYDGDLGFAATLAAGLEDSGFDPNIVIDDPQYRMRESPSGSREPLSDSYRDPRFEVANDLDSSREQGPSPPSSTFDSVSDFSPSETGSLVDDPGTRRRSARNERRRRERQRAAQQQETSRLVDQGPPDISAREIGGGSAPFLVEGESTLVDKIEKSEPADVHPADEWHAATDTIHKLGEIEPMDFSREVAASTQDPTSQPSAQERKEMADDDFGALTPLLECKKSSGAAVRTNMEPTPEVIAAWTAVVHDVPTAFHKETLPAFELESQAELTKGLPAEEIGYSTWGDDQLGPDPRVLLPTIAEETASETESAAGPKAEPELSAPVESEPEHQSSPKTSETGLEKVTRSLDSDPVFQSGAVHPEVATERSSAVSEAAPVEVVAVPHAQPLATGDFTDPSVSFSADSQRELEPPASPRTSKKKRSKKSKKAATEQSGPEIPVEREFDYPEVEQAVAAELIENASPELPGTASEPIVATVVESTGATPSEHLPYMTTFVDEPVEPTSLPTEAPEEFQAAEIMEPAQPSQAVEAVEAAAIIEPAQPSQVDEPVEAVEAADPVAPAEAVEADDSFEAVALAGFAQAVQAAESAKPPEDPVRHETTETPNVPDLTLAPDAVAAETEVADDQSSECQPATPTGEKGDNAEPSPSRLDDVESIALSPQLGDKGARVADSSFESPPTTPTKRKDEKTPSKLEEVETVVGSPRLGGLDNQDISSSREPAEAATSAEADIRTEATTPASEPSVDAEKPQTEAVDLPASPLSKEKAKKARKAALAALKEDEPAVVASAVGQVDSGMGGDKDNPEPEANNDKLQTEIDSDKLPTETDIDELQTETGSRELQIEDSNDRLHIETGSDQPQTEADRELPQIEAAGDGQNCAPDEKPQIEAGNDRLHTLPTEVDNDNLQAYNDKLQTETDSDKPQTQLEADLSQTVVEEDKPVAIGVETIDAIETEPPTAPTTPSKKKSKKSKKSKKAASWVETREHSPLGERRPTDLDGSSEALMASQAVEMDTSDAASAAPDASMAASEGVVISSEDVASAPEAALATPATLAAVTEVFAAAPDTSMDIHDASTAGFEAAPAAPEAAVPTSDASAAASGTATLAPDANAAVPAAPATVTELTTSAPDNALDPGTTDRSEILDEVEKAEKGRPEEDLTVAFDTPGDKEGHPDGEPPDKDYPLDEAAQRDMASAESGRTPVEDASEHPSNNVGGKQAFETKLNEPSPGGPSSKARQMGGGGFFSFFKGFTEDPVKTVPGGDKKPSFLAKAGTIGAGAGLAGVAAIFSSASRVNATPSNATSPTTPPSAEAPADDQAVSQAPAEGPVEHTVDEAVQDIVEPDGSLEDPSAEAGQLDPEIVARAIKPAIDPQFGDLLPLPPSRPASPVEPDLNDELPPLPESRPQTPPQQERDMMKQKLASRRRSVLEISHTRSPSNTAIPLQFRLRSAPSSPNIKTSPIQPPLAAPSPEPGSATKRFTRPMSWGMSREIKPLYLPEHVRSGTQAESEQRLPELPPSEPTSDLESPASEFFSPSERDADYFDQGNTGFGGLLRLDTSISDTFRSAPESLGSEENTPKAERGLHPADIMSQSFLSQSDAGSNDTFEDANSQLFRSAAHSPGPMAERSSPPRSKSLVHDQHAEAGLIQPSPTSAPVVMGLGIGFKDVAHIRDVTGTDSLPQLLTAEDGDAKPMSPPGITDANTVARIHLADAPDIVPEAHIDKDKDKEHKSEVALLNDPVALEEEPADLEQTTWTNMEKKVKKSMGKTTPPTVEGDTVLNLTEPDHSVTEAVLSGAQDNALERPVNETSSASADVTETSNSIPLITPESAEHTDKSSPPDDKDTPAQESLSPQDQETLTQELLVSKDTVLAADSLPSSHTASTGNEEGSEGNLAVALLEVAESEIRVTGIEPLTPVEPSTSAVGTEHAEITLVPAPDDNPISVESTVSDSEIEITDAQISSEEREAAHSSGDQVVDTPVVDGQPESLSGDEKQETSGKQGVSETLATQSSQDLSPLSHDMEEEPNREQMPEAPTSRPDEVQQEPDMFSQERSQIPAGDAQEKQRELPTSPGSMPEEPAPGHLVAPAEVSLHDEPSTTTGPSSPTEPGKKQNRGMKSAAAESEEVASQPDGSLVHETPSTVDAGSPHDVGAWKDVDTLANPEATVSLASVAEVDSTRSIDQMGSQAGSPGASKTIETTPPLPKSGARDVTAGDSGTRRDSASLFGADALASAAAAGVGAGVLLASGQDGQGSPEAQKTGNSTPTDSPTPAEGVAEWHVGAAQPGPAIDAAEARGPSGVGEAGVETGGPIEGSLQPEIAEQTWPDTQPLPAADTATSLLPDPPTALAPSSAATDAPAVETIEHTASAHTPALGSSADLQQPSSPRRHAENAPAGPDNAEHLSGLDEPAPTGTEEAHNAPSEEVSARADPATETAPAANTGLQTSVPAPAEITYVQAPEQPTSLEHTEAAQTRHPGEGNVDDHRPATPLNDFRPEPSGLVLADHVPELASPETTPGTKPKKGKKRKKQGTSESLDDAAPPVEQSKAVADLESPIEIPDDAPATCDSETIVEPQYAGFKVQHTNIDGKDPDSNNIKNNEAALDESSAGEPQESSKNIPDSPKGAADHATDALAASAPEPLDPEVEPTFQAVEGLSELSPGDPAHQSQCESALAPSELRSLAERLATNGEVDDNRTHTEVAIPQGPERSIETPAADSADDGTVPSGSLGQPLGGPETPDLIEPAKDDTAEAETSDNGPVLEEHLIDTIHPLAAKPKDEERPLKPPPSKTDADEAVGEALPVLDIPPSSSQEDSQQSTQATDLSPVKLSKKQKKRLKKQGITFPDPEAPLLSETIGSSTEDLRVVVSEPVVVPDATPEELSVSVSAPGTTEQPPALEVTWDTPTKQAQKNKQRNPQQQEAESTSQLASSGPAVPDVEADVAAQAELGLPEPSETGQPLHAPTSAADSVPLSPIVDTEVPHDEAPPSDANEPPNPSPIEPPPSSEISHAELPSTPPSASELDNLGLKTHMATEHASDTAMEPAAEVDAVPAHDALEPQETINAEPSIQPAVFTPQDTEISTESSASSSDPAPMRSPTSNAVKHQLEPIVELPEDLPPDASQDEPATSAELATRAQAGALDVVPVVLASEVGLESSTATPTEPPVEITSFETPLKDQADVQRPLEDSSPPTVPEDAPPETVEREKTVVEPPEDATEGEGLLNLPTATKEESPPEVPAGTAITTDAKVHFEDSADNTSSHPAADSPQSSAGGALTEPRTDDPSDTCAAPDRSACLVDDTTEQVHSSSDPAPSTAGPDSTREVLNSEPSAMLRSDLSADATAAALALGAAVLIPSDSTPDDASTSVAAKESEKDKSLDMVAAPVQNIPEPQPAVHDATTLSVSHDTRAPPPAIVDTLVLSPPSTEPAASGHALPEAPTQEPHADKFSRMESSASFQADPTAQTQSSTAQMSDRGASGEINALDAQATGVHKELPKIAAKRSKKDDGLGGLSGSVGIPVTEQQTETGAAKPSKAPADVGLAEAVTLTPTKSEESKREKSHDNALEAEQSLISSPDSKSAISGSQPQASIVEIHKAAGGEEGYFNMEPDAAPLPLTIQPSDTALEVHPVVSEDLEPMRKEADYLPPSPPSKGLYLMTREGSDAFLKDGHIPRLLTAQTDSPVISPQDLKSGMDTKPSLDNKTSSQHSTDDNPPSCTAAKEQAGPIRDGNRLADAPPEPASPPNDISINTAVTAAVVGAGVAALTKSSVGSKKTKYKKPKIIDPRMDRDDDNTALGEAKLKQPMEISRGDRNSVSFRKMAEQSAGESPRGSVSTAEGVQGADDVGEESRVAMDVDPRDSTRSFLSTTTDRGLDENGRRGGTMLHRDMLSDFGGSPMLGVEEKFPERVPLTESPTDLTPRTSPALESESKFLPSPRLPTGQQQTPAGTVGPGIHDIQDLRRTPSRTLEPVLEEDDGTHEPTKHKSKRRNKRGPRDVDRDSGYAADSPLAAFGRARTERQETRVRDSGVHLRDWPEGLTQVRDVGGFSPDATRRLSPTAAPSTPIGDPSRRRLSPLKDEATRELKETDTPRLRGTEPQQPNPEPQKQGSGSSVSSGGSLSDRKRGSYREQLGSGSIPTAIMATAARERAPQTPAEDRRGSDHSILSRRMSPASPLAGQRPYGGVQYYGGSGQRAMSNTSVARRRTPDLALSISPLPESPVSLRSVGNTPPLRRADRRMSGDLRSINQLRGVVGHQPQPRPTDSTADKDVATRGAGTVGAADATVAAPANAAAAAAAAVAALGLAAAATLSSPDAPASANNNSTPIANEGRVRAREMADVYDGYGEGRIGSPRSPTRPHSMRRRQSMQVIELEARVEQLSAENRSLHEARAQAEQAQTHKTAGALADRDDQIDALKRSVKFLTDELARLTEINEGLHSAISQTALNRDDRYRLLEAQHADTARELEEVRRASGSGTTPPPPHKLLAEKDLEIARLRAELEEAKQQIRELQRQILATKGLDGDFLVAHDIDYFDHRCQQLCSHVQQWVLRFSKFSDMRACRLTGEINDEKIIDRLDNSVLDGSDVDNYLRDRVRRRDIFMSMTMSMIWEFVFTRYLFGMDREQRQKLKSLEKHLLEVGPPHAVRQWRAVTLTLLARRTSFRDQKEQDTEAVVQAVLQTLSMILPPPSNLEDQIQSQLRRVMREAVDLAVEMRTQRAEYVMLPPLQPEYDANGDLAATVPFNATMMHERSADTTKGQELEADSSTVRIVLFPLVVRKGDDQGRGDDEVVVHPAQVLISRPSGSSRRGGGRLLTPSSDAGGASLLGRNTSPISAPPTIRSTLSMPDAEPLEGGF